MKLNKNFVVHNIGNEVVLIPTANASFSGIVEGNKTMGEILEFLKEDTTESEIIKRLHSKYLDESNKIENDVFKVIIELKKIGAIDEQVDF